MAACSEWADVAHTYFQIANLFLMFTYFLPNNIKGLLLLRAFLGSAGVFFTLGAALTWCAPDALAWSLLFMVINYGHASYILYKTRKIIFNDENEVVYTSLFEPLGIKRWQYAPLAKINTVKQLREEDVFTVENKTHGECVSIMISGSIRVEKNTMFLNRLKPYEFIDSPEWIISTQSGGAMPVTYEVSIVSEGCVIIQWERKILMKILKKHSLVKNVFDSIIDCDVTKKLFASQKSLLHQLAVETETKSVPLLMYELSGTKRSISSTRNFDSLFTHLENPKGICNPNFRKETDGKRSS